MRSRKAYKGLGGRQRAARSTFAQLPSPRRADVPPLDDDRATLSDAADGGATMDTHGDTAAGPAVVEWAVKDTDESDAIDELAFFKNNATSWVTIGRAVKGDRP